MVKSTEMLRKQATTIESTKAPASDALAWASALTGARPSVSRDHTPITTAQRREVQTVTSRGVKAAFPSGPLTSKICCMVALTERRMLPLKTSTKPSREKATWPSEAMMVPITMTARGYSSTVLSGWPNRKTVPKVTRGVVAETTSTKEVVACTMAMLDTETEVACAAATGRKKVTHCCPVGQFLSACQMCAQMNAAAAEPTKWLMVRKSGKAKF
mmetsp:Transcript_47441/g.122586  ORF Transcript_47441/g.122586 Transcript_47441/m.122586 type:complete len:215 (-) Transcript_47441:113-757(-)